MKELLAILFILGSRSAIAEHSLGDWLEDVVTSDEPVGTSFTPVRRRRGAAPTRGDPSATEEKPEQTPEQKKAEEKEKKAQEEDKAAFEKDPKAVTSEDEARLNSRILELNQRLNDEKNPLSEEEQNEIKTRLAGLETLRRSWSLPDAGSAVTQSSQPAPPAPLAVDFNETPPTESGLSPVTEKALSILKPPAPPSQAPAPAPPATAPPAPVRPSPTLQTNAPAPYLAGPRTTLSPISPPAPSSQATRSAPSPDAIASAGSQTLPILRSPASALVPSSDFSPSLPAAPPAAPPPPASGRPLAPAPAPGFVSAPASVQAVLQAPRPEASSINSIIAAPSSSFSIGGAPAVDLPAAPPTPAFPATPVAGREEMGRGFSFKSGDPMAIGERPRTAESETYGPMEPQSPAEVPAEPRGSRAIAPTTAETLAEGYNVPEGIDPEAPPPSPPANEKPKPSGPVQISAKPKPDIAAGINQLKALIAEEEKDKQQKAEAQLTDLTSFMNDP